MDNLYIYTCVKTYAAALETRIEKLEKLAKGLPTGHLKIDHAEGKTIYRIRDSSAKRSTNYIAKDDIKAIIPLANKKYISAVLPKLRKNYRAASAFLKLYSGTEENIIATKMPIEVQRLNSNIKMCEADFVYNWLHQPYRRNPYHPENLVHSTLRGEMMRSKSEVMIANALYNHDQAYLPEMGVWLNNGTTVYPDFIILKPYSHEIIYWEHFGLMGDEAYADNACKKIAKYVESGFFPGKNLICTFESKETPLSSTQVEMYIKEYLL